MRAGAGAGAGAAAAGGVPPGGRGAACDRKAEATTAPAAVAITPNAVLVCQRTGRKAAKPVPDRDLARQGRDDRSDIYARTRKEPNKVPAEDRVLFARRD